MSRSNMTWALLLVSCAGSSSSRTNPEAAESSFWRGDRRQSVNRRVSENRPRGEEEEKSPLDGDRFGTAVRTRREHESAHSGEALRLESFSHPACAPLAAAERRACPLSSKRWARVKRIAGGIELWPQGRIDPALVRLQLACHLAYGRTLEEKGACPLHLRGVQTRVLEDKEGIRVQLLGRDLRQISELQAWMKALQYPP